MRFNNSLGRTLHPRSDKDNYMTRILCLIPLLLLLTACSSSKNNYAQCILDNMPGTNNMQTRGLIHNQCREQYPDMYYSIEKGSGRGLITYDNGHECTIAHAKDTLNDAAVTNIRQACSCLYDEPDSKDQRCDYPRSQYNQETSKKPWEYDWKKE